MNPKYILSAMMFTYFAASAILFPLFSIYLSRSFTSEQIGILMALIPVSMIFFQPLWGKLANRYGIQAILVLALSLSAVSAIGLLFVKTFIQYFIVLSVYSVFVVSVPPLIDTLTLSIAGKQFGNIRLWGSVGYGLAVFFSGTFKSYILGYWSFILHIFFLILTMVIVIKIADIKNITLINSVKAPQNDPKDRTIKNNISPFRNKQFLAIAAASFILGIALKSYETFFPIELEALNASDLLLGSSWIIELIPEVIIFYILDKLDSKLPSRIIMAAGILIWTIRMAILSIFPVLWIWIATQPLNSLAFCFWYLGINKTLISTLTPEQKIEGIAIFWAITYGVGGVSGSLLGGYAVKIFGIPVMFGFIAGCCFISFMLNIYILARNQTLIKLPKWNKHLP